MSRDRTAHPTKRSSRPDDYCLVFMHIPKTAGTTLASSLKWNYPPHLTLHYDLLGRMKDIEKIPTEELSSARLFIGHLPYGVHRYIPRPCEYVTVLREPVARVISAYKYIRRTAHHGLHDRVVGDHIGLEEFIETFWVDKRISRQTRQLCELHNGPLNPEDLLLAKRNLESFLVVGLTERFEETFALVRRALRLRVPFYVTRNVGQPLHASERALELIREREQYDLELYEFARGLFAHQVARAGSSLELEAAVFRALRPLSRMAGAGGTAEFIRRMSHARAAWDKARATPRS
jgi:Sulfotransferase family